ncbi:MAG: nucleoside transporter [Planctomycetota bacterium]
MARTIADRLDQLYEFEREPVSPAGLQGGARFAGLYAGEHVAATEFVIGALFVSWGARTTDVLYGLLIGNLLAVLSWALVCAPIAIRTRLTLYWYLRRIAGPGVTALYNVLNAVLYCILAGSMITVSASAVRIPFGIPAQTGWLPADPGFVVVVLGVGAVVTVLAIWGFDKLSQFATLCSPWLIAMFVVGALLTLPALAAAAGLPGIASWSDFRTVADGLVWTGTPAEGGEAVGMGQIAALAWICNIAMHLGLSDMAILRYAKRASYGLYSACGMFLGHYLAWIAAGVMGGAAALALRAPLTTLDSGQVAFEAAGLAGAVAVVIAGWTTANPTLYRAGLALQATLPGWPRWKVTLVAGALTTVVACSPFVFLRLLDFVAIYGILLAPVGGIVFVEHWLFARLGLRQFWAEGRPFNWPALVAWLATSGAALVLWRLGTVNVFYLGVPAWLAGGVLYLLAAPLAGARAAGTVPPAATSVRPALDPPPPGPRRPSLSTAGRIAAILTVGSLIACFAVALWTFLGEPAGHVERAARAKHLLAWASLLYFGAVVVWVRGRPAPS